MIHRGDGTEQSCRERVSRTWVPVWVMDPSPRELTWSHVRSMTKSI